MRGTQGLRLGIVHNPILSREIARGRARRADDAADRRARSAPTPCTGGLFALRGTVDGARATTAQAKEIGVDVEAPAADIARQVDEALAAQEKIASGIGFSVTPSYVLNGIAPLRPSRTRPRSRRMIAAVKDCDALICA